MVAPRGSAEQPVPVRLIKAEADYSQKGFDVKGAIDGDPKTGWAVDSDKIGSPRTATFTFDKPVQLPAGAHFIIRLEQQYGEQHTLGHFRLSLGHRHHVDDPQVERKAQIEQGLRAWQERERARHVHWTVLRPATAT
jgi:hypothetical protein